MGRGQSYIKDAQALRETVAAGRRPRDLQIPENRDIIETTAQDAFLDAFLGRAAAATQQELTPFLAGFTGADADGEASSAGEEYGALEIGRSLGAKSKNYDVLDLETGEYYQFVEGTRLQDVQVFAGKGSKKPYRRAWRFANQHGGKAEDWQHVKGIGYLATEEGDRRAEVHWSQCPGVGKFEFFIKEWLD